LREEDAALMGETYISDNQNIYLPASFLGSNKWASEQIADSLAIAATYGPPTFFVTMTCNTNWPEIQSRLRPGQDFTDIPTVVIRVFRRKLALLEETLSTMFPNAGHLLYMVHSVEFQK
jgi:Helitron helicase-like domain at N-terminus